MILRLIKHALKATLHEAVEEWAEEFGLPHAVVQEVRARRWALAEQEVAQTDARAAAALGVEDDVPPSVLPMPAAARLTTLPPIQDSNEVNSSPSRGAEDENLMVWVHQQRQADVSWANIVRLAAEKGHTLSEEALRCRHRRWLQRSGPDAQPEDG